MKAILVAGIGEPAGKTAFIAGAAASILEQGKRVAYLKIAPAEDADVWFIREALRIDSGIGRPPESVDIVLAEWPGRLAEALTAARQIGADVIALVRYRQGLTSAAATAEALSPLGASPNVVFNAVPERLLPRFGDQVVATLRNDGVRVLGVAPESRALLGFTVAELAQGLGAEFLVHQIGRAHV